MSPKKPILPHTHQDRGDSATVYAVSQNQIQIPNGNVAAAKAENSAGHGHRQVDSSEAMSLCTWLLILPRSTLSLPDNGVLTARDCVSVGINTSKQFSPIPMPSV